MDIFKLNNIELIEETLTGLIRMGRKQMEALEELQEELEGDPRHVKTWTECAKNVSDLTDKLMKLEKMKASKEVLKPKDQGQISKDGTTYIQNTVFMGSSDDILKIIERDKGIISVEDIKGE